MTDFKVYSDSELLIEIAGGSEPAFRQLYGRYAGKVYNMSFKYLRSSFFAQDAVQDIFSRVWQKRTALPDLNNFDSWLTAVTRNFLLNLLQKKIPLALAGEIGCAAQADRIIQAQHQAEYTQHRAEYHELEILIRRAILQLPPRQQQVYRLRQEECLSHKEIADRLNISGNVAREHMSKALKHIRSFLEKHYAQVILLLCLVKEFL